MASSIKDFMDNVGGSTDLADPVVKKRAANALPVPTPAPVSGSGGSLPMPAPSTAFQVGQNARSAIGSGLDAISAIPKATYGALSSAASAAGSGIADFSRGAAGLPATSPPAPVAAPAPAAKRMPNATDAATANTSPLFSLNLPGNPASTVAPSMAAAPAAPTGALSISGRPLGYGAQVNGVPTFSDGSGGPGAVPRTMSDAQIEQLNAFTAAPTGAGAAPVAGAAALPRPVADTGNGWNDPLYQAQHGAESDMAAIAREDPRSVLGSAAREARMNLGGMKAPRSRYGGSGGRTPYEDALSALYAHAHQPVLDAQQKRLVDATQAGETARTNITQAGETQRELLRPGSPTPLEDGTLGLLGPGGLVRPAIDATGKPVRPLQTKIDSGTKQEDLVAATAAKLFQESQFSAKPLTIDEARDQAAKLHGAGAAPAPEHVALLKKNATPDMRAKFDQAYGKGAAAKVLGS